MERTTRYSKKREAILTALKETQCHPSAEWIYQALKPNHPDLSLGTVYRNLSFFLEQGIIQSVGVVKGQERFDAFTEPHSHFVCEECSAVQDLDGIPVDHDLNQRVSDCYGVAVQRHDLTFYGVCQECLTKNNEEETEV
ncbi:MAG: transcriptional repressor [Clostridium sp.]|nr:transcriptional repressor [Clostridium sp.]